MEFTPSKKLLNERKQKTKQTKISNLFFTPKKATKVHERKKPFKCDLCSAEFTNEIILIDHVSTEHEGKKQTKISSLFFTSKKATVHERKKAI